jgi:hypothetical protein
VASLLIAGVVLGSVLGTMSSSKGPGNTGMASDTDME